MIKVRVKIKNDKYLEMERVGCSFHGIPFGHTEKMEASDWGWDRPADENVTTQTRVQRCFWWPRSRQNVLRRHTRPVTPVAGEELIRHWQGTWFRAFQRRKCVPQRRCVAVCARVSVCWVQSCGHGVEAHHKRRQAHAWKRRSRTQARRRHSIIYVPIDGWSSG
jgi:hypothetical protein